MKKSDTRRSAKFRMQFDCSQENLILLLGMDRSHYTRYEQGKRSIPDKSLWIIVKVERALVEMSEAAVEFKESGADNYSNANFIRELKMEFLKCLSRPKKFRSELEVLKRNHDRASAAIINLNKLLQSSTKWEARERRWIEIRLDDSQGKLKRSTLMHQYKAEIKLITAIGALNALVMKINGLDSNNSENTDLMEYTRNAMTGVYTKDITDGLLSSSFGME